MIQQDIPDVQPVVPNPSAELHNLSALSLDELINKVVSHFVQFAINLAIAIIVFYVGKFIIRKIYRLVGSIMLRRRVDQSLTTFVLSFIRIVLYFILIVTVIGILGIETSSFLALFASAGVAIGMALSGTLQNFAGGVLILLLKPYKIGDYIEAQGYAGTVKEIQIFHTIINTSDNKSIIIPNGGLSTSSINNWSREDYRRIEWTVSISYGNNVETARDAILGMLASDSRIVKEYIEDARKAYDEEEALKAGVSAGEVSTEPVEKKRGWFYRLFHHKKKVKTVVEKWNEEREKKLLAMIPKVKRAPSVSLGSLAASSVDLSVKAWARTEDYWAVYYDINERIYNDLPKYGISFPFPQMDVYLKQNL